MFPTMESALRSVNNSSNQAATEDRAARLRPAGRERQESQKKQFVNSMRPRQTGNTDSNGGNRRAVHASPTSHPSSRSYSVDMQIGHPATFAPLRSLAGCPAERGASYVPMRTIERTSDAITPSSERGTSRNPRAAALSRWGSDEGTVSQSLDDDSSATCWFSTGGWGATTLRPPDTHTGRCNASPESALHHHPLPV